MSSDNSALSLILHITLLPFHVPTLTQRFIITLLLTCSLTVLVCTLLWSIQKKYKFELKGPPGFPIVGHLPLLGDRPDKTFEAWSKLYGPVFRIRMGSRYCLVIHGLAAVRQALINQADDFAGRPNFHSYGRIAAGKSMAFGGYGAVHKKQRTIVQSAMLHFTQRQRPTMEDTINREADVLMDELLSAAQPASIGELVHVTAASVIYSLCFGDGVNVRDDKNFLDYLRDDAVFAKIMETGKCVADFLPWTIPLIGGRGFMRQFIDVQNRLLATVRSKLSLIRPTWVPSQPRNFFDALLDSCQGEKFGMVHGEAFTEEHIINLPVELIGAGHSTASITLRWAFLLMAQYPDIQAQVHAEIDAILGHERQPSYMDRWELSLCEAVVLETLRFATIQPFLLPHATTQACRFYGFDVPQGALVLINMRSVLRDPTVWQDPHIFNPKRFLDPKTGRVDRQLQAMAPNFGMGRRKCPGEMLGRMKVFLVFVRVMQRCRFDFPAGARLDLEGKFNFTVEPLDHKMHIAVR